jgi:RecA-family ATPase
VVDGWLGLGDATLFGGEWGTGKSLIALDLALAIASGGDWLGRIRVAQKVPVLYLDEENNPVNATRRIARMIAGREMDPDSAAGLPLTYGTKNRIKLDVPAGYATIERLLVEKECKVVILDSFIRFGRLNASKNDELARFFDEAIAPLIGRYGCSVVMLDHMRKPNEGDDKTDIAHRITGGADKSGFADNVWVIHGKRDETTRTFEARKNRWEDTLQPPLTTTWEVSEDELSARITATDATLNAEAVVLGALLDAGSQGLFATELFDLAERRSVPKRTAIRTIKRLVRKGGATKLLLPGKRVRYSLA